MKKDNLKIDKITLTSRLIVGTGKYKNFKETAEAVKASGAAMVTVAVRRVNILDRNKPVLMDYLNPKKIVDLPNTAGCFNSEDALRTLRLAREMGGWKLVKLEVLGDKKTLYPNMIETLKSTKILVKEGFKVMVYCSDDPIIAKKLEELGASAIMPLASPIGSGRGIRNKLNLSIILNNSKVPVIVDAGIGTASDAAIAMELGCDGVLINTAIAKAKNPILMAESMKHAVLAGRKALVIGYGDVGKGSAQSLKQEGMVVRVTEIDPICAMQACMDGYEVVSPYVDGVNNDSEESMNLALLEDTDLIVTTTGNYKVCDKHMLKAVKNGAVICNIGHFDTEIDTQYMRDEWCWEEVKPQVHKIFRDTKAGDKPNLDSDDYIILLSEGRLVNLGNATGHPSRIMDGSFANQVLAQMYLFEKKFAQINDEDKKQELIKVEVLPKKLDEEVAAYMVEGFGGVMTKLSSDQAEYINVPEEGPFKSDIYKY